MTPKSPSLEAVSTDRIEQRRMPRFHFGSELLRVERLGKTFAVLDVSRVGLSVRVLEADDRVVMTVGARVEGILSLRRRRYPMSLRIVHVVGHVVGCEIEKIASDVKADFEKQLSPSALGKELELMVERKEDFEWYHAPLGTDLVIQKKDGKWAELTVFVFQDFVRWTEGEGLVTGRAIHVETDEAEPLSLVALETMRLELDEKPVAVKVAVARELLKDAEIAPDKKKKMMGLLGA